MKLLWHSYLVHNLTFCFSHVSRGNKKSTPSINFHNYFFSKILFTKSNLKIKMLCQNKFRKDADITFTKAKLL
jgi:hypothetical protein